MFNNNSYLNQLIYKYNIYINLLKKIFDSIFTNTGIYYNDKISDVYEKLYNITLNLYDEIQKNDETFFSDVSILAFLPSNLNNLKHSLYYELSPIDSGDISRLKEEIEMEFHLELYYLSSLKSEHGLGLLEYKLDQQEINFLDYCNKTIQEYILEKNEYCEKVNNICNFALNNKDANFNKKYNFSFIKDEYIKTILTLDYNELQKAYQHHLYKTTIIFIISIIEGILTYSLIQSEKEALNSFNKLFSDEKQNNIKHWKLHQILDVAKDIGIIEKIENKIICYLKDYRNLVHPYSNNSNKDLKISQKTAAISLLVLDFIYNSVSDYIQKIEIIDANNS